MSQNINWTSPKEWPMPVKVAAGGAAVVGAGAALMYLLKKVRFWRVLLKTLALFNLLF
jgi:hypothetical protein